MRQGFFKLQRRVFSHWLWEEPRELSRFEAFLDLLQLAAFEPTKRIVSGRCIEVPIGGIVASERFLSERWKWSRTKVRSFLEMLQSDGMVKPEKDQPNTVLILCNYKAWNESSDHKKTTDQPDENHRGTTGKPNIINRRTKRTPNAPTEELGFALDGTSSAQAPEKIRWSLETKFTGITEERLRDWKEAFPAVDVNRQLAAAHMWLKDNPSKAKKSNFGRFLTNWMSRRQDQGGDIRSNQPQRKRELTSDDVGI